MGCEPSLQAENKNLKQGNISLGSDNNHFVSTSRGTYNHKVSNFKEVQDMAKYLSKDLKSSHFSMGKSNEPMSTIARES